MFEFWFWLAFLILHFPHFSENHEMLWHFGKVIWVSYEDLPPLSYLNTEGNQREHIVGESKNHKTRSMWLRLESACALKMRCSLLSIRNRTWWEQWTWNYVLSVFLKYRFSQGEARGEGSLWKLTHAMLKQMLCLFSYCGEYRYGSLLVMNSMPFTSQCVVQRFLESPTRYKLCECLHN